jgi:hypothetical protein
MSSMLSNNVNPAKAIVPNIITAIPKAFHVSERLKTSQSACWRRPIKIPESGYK